MRPWLKLDPPGTRTRFGTFLQISDPAIAECLAALPFDFLCVEGEHSPIGAAAAERLIAACDRHGMPCLVRVPAGESVWIKQALDAGAAGIVVPCIESPEDVEAAVRAARFPPAGARGCGPGRASNFGRDIPRYVAEADLHVKVVVQVETRPAMERLDRILAVDGIDLVLVGPGDLSIAYREAVGDPPADSAPLVAEIARRCHQAGLPVATFAFDADGAAAARAAGMDAVIIATDLMFAGQAAAATLEALRAD